MSKLFLQFTWAAVSLHLAEGAEELPLILPESAMNIYPHVVESHPTRPHENQLREGIAEVLPPNEQQQLQREYEQKLKQNKFHHAGVRKGQKMLFHWIGSNAIHAAGAPEGVVSEILPVDGASGESRMRLKFTTRAKAECVEGRRHWRHASTARHAFFGFFAKLTAEAQKKQLFLFEVQTWNAEQEEWRVSPMKVVFKPNKELDARRLYGDDEYINGIELLVVFEPKASSYHCQEQLANDLI